MLLLFHAHYLTWHLADHCHSMTGSTVGFQAHSHDVGFQHGEHPGGDHDHEHGHYPHPASEHDFQMVVKSGKSIDFEALFLFGKPHLIPPAPEICMLLPVGEVSRTALRVLTPSDPRGPPSV